MIESFFVFSIVDNVNPFDFHQKNKMARVIDFEFVYVRAWRVFVPLIMKPNVRS